MDPKSAASSLSETLRVLVEDVDPSSSSGPCRLYAHPTVLRSFNTQAGSAIAVLPKSGSLSSNSSIFVANIWPRSSLSIQEISVPSSLLPPTNKGRYDTELPTLEASLVSIPSEIRTATTVFLSYQTNEDSSPNNKEYQDILQAWVRESLLSRKYVLQGQSVSVDVAGIDKTLKVTSITSDEELIGKVPAKIPIQLHDLYKSVASVARTTEVVIQKAKVGAAPHQDVQLNGSLQKEAAYATLGGLDKQIAELRRLVELPLRRPEVFKQYGLRPPRGLLLFGPPGTGKTTLAYSAAKSCVSPSSIVTISGPELSSSLHGGTERALRKVFAKAHSLSPCVIIIDEIDALAPRRDGDSDGSGEVEKRVVATLLTLMDGLGNEAESRVVVIAATNRPNAIDPALRRPGRLDKEIEVGIPDSEARLSILRVLLHPVPHTLSDAQIKQVASRTYGYVGADLSSLVREAGMRALTRHVSAANTDLESHMNSLSLSQASTFNSVTYEDFLAAQSSIRPSAMREVTLELPKVAWDDIAPGASGLEVQRRVRECVEWPLKYKDTMRTLGIDAPRGVLLYGPPGCSKTLIARALASESGLNFLAVKGPELLNKFVGESERSLREVFRKARAASPSIVFFDEIDGLTTSRGSDNGAGDKLITTLLNEMDGIEQLADVLVVAATNRPDVLDPALLRPGRLDRLLYVGPPDYEARLQILQIRAKKMSLADDVQLPLLAQMTEGCSGAEVVSICQDAGLQAMNEDVHAKYIYHRHLEGAARTIRRRITAAMLRKYEAWRDQAAK